MKKHIITITGFPGSGKSSTAKGVASGLGYEHFSSGDMFRKMAADRNLSIEEINFTAEKKKEIDFEVDRLLVKMGKEKNNFVIDSRTAFHWMPDSFKVFLDLDSRVAAERTFAQIQRVGRKSQEGSSVDEVYENTVKRVESERKRYRNLYDIDITDNTKFDLIVDTKINNLEEVVGIIIAAYQKWLNVPELK
ncbi:MAG: AAA family ATPase [Candidatus Liptonbacteria bacterium]|nr:AAA family ATPase [Candidatus Liptonbacteria bacterium]